MLLLSKRTYHLNQSYLSYLCWWGVGSVHIIQKFPKRVRNKPITDPFIRLLLIVYYTVVLIDRDDYLASCN